MHGNPNLSLISPTLSSLSSPSLLPSLWSQSKSYFGCSYHHGSDFKLPWFHTSSNFPLRLNKKKKRRSSSLPLRAAGSGDSPYQVLGVSPSATPQEIKRAYRKLALKFHPDVNKQANAQEKFMRIKHAYNTLLNSESRRRYDYGRGTYRNERNQTKNTPEEQDFYGFGNFLKDVQITIGDFFRDLQVEFQNWEATAGSQGKPKSLWEELADIGEEFVEFLEKELNITESKDEAQSSNSWSEEGNTSAKSGQQRGGSDVQNDNNKQSSIEDNIDEIEATLAQLKKELGLQ